MAHPTLHPRDALFDPGEPAPPALPVCDHYCGVAERMHKSLALQAELGPVFDITLDGEDGAPVGAELEHAQLMAGLVNSAANRFGRVGVRVHPVQHPRFDAEVDLLVRTAGHRLAYLVCPKPRGLADLQRFVQVVDDAARRHGLARQIPLHALVETHGALREVQALATHPRLQCLSFGLMDFVSAHHGAVPMQAMTVQGQFSHPLVVRAKLELAAACLGHGKVPSYCVVTEFKDEAALATAARRAAREFGYLRMWSIHPAQVRVIVQAFAPDADEVAAAGSILLAAQAAQWAPVRHHHQGQDRLHDRASYRYCWLVLERAHRTGQPLAAAVRQAFFPDVTGITPAAAA